MSHKIYIYTMSSLCTLSYHPVIAILSVMIFFFRSAKKAIECFDLVVALNKYGDTFSNLLMRFYWSEGKLNMQLFFRLLKEV